MNGECELYRIVATALRQNIREYVSRGGGALDLDPADTDYLATKVMLASEDEGVIGEPV